MSEDEARRAIGRMEQQREKLVAPADAADSPDDPIEKLGRRIARILGYAIAAALGYYLWTQLHG